MIDIKELRIGNLIKDSLNDDIVTVKELREEGIIYAVFMGVSRHYENNMQKVEMKFDLDLVKYEDAEAIPFTPEILRNCGFELENKSWVIGELTWTPYTDPSTQALKLLILVRWEDDNAVNYDIEYLHQLQNLYFTITKKELEIKL